MIPTDEITIKIPGSTGNVGPGFDCIGLAVNIFNKISIKKSDKNFEIENNGVSKEKYDEIPYEQNLIVKGIKLSYPEIDLEKYKIINDKIAVATKPLYKAFIIFFDCPSFTKKVLSLIHI